MSKIKTIKSKIEKLFPRSTVGGDVYFKESDREKLKNILKDMANELIECKPNLTGTTDPHKCFVCGKPADVGYGNALGPQRGYCRKHMSEMPTGTAGECTCNIKSNELAGICNYCYPRSKMKAYLDLERELFPSHGLTKEKIEEICSPNLPLNAKVARDLRKIADALEKEEMYGRV